MNLFDLFGSRNRTRSNDDMAIAPGAKDGKIYRWVQLISISVALAALVLLVFELTTLLKMGQTANGVVFSIGVVGLAGFVALPWVRVFESYKQKPYRITSIVFLALIGVCAVLWIVCVWMIVGLVAQAISGADDTEILNNVSSSLQVIRVSLIISIQFIIASYIAKNVIKYGKTLLPYQVMSGLSQLYIDFYLILVATAISVNAEGVVFNQSALLLRNVWFHALLVVAIVLGIFPNTVFAKTDRKKMKDAQAAGAPGETFGVENANTTANNTNANNASTNNTTANNTNAQIFDNVSNNTGTTSVDEKLRKIKELLDKGLITQEEYDKKREEIISNI